MAWPATGMPRSHPRAGAIGSRHWLSTLVWKRAPGHPTEITAVPDRTVHRRIRAPPSLVDNLSNAVAERVGPHQQGDVHACPGSPQLRTDRIPDPTSCRTGHYLRRHRALIGAVDGFTVSPNPASDPAAHTYSHYPLPAEMTATGEIVDGKPHIHRRDGRPRRPDHRRAPAHGAPWHLVRVTTTPESSSSNWPTVWLLIHQPPNDGYPIVESCNPRCPHTSMRLRRNGGPHALIPVGADVTGPASVIALAASAACFRGAA
jgi:hypothetical protein